MSAACAASLTRPLAPARRVRASAPRGRALVVRSVAADDAVDSVVDVDAANATSPSAVDATATSSSPGAWVVAAAPLKKRLMALAAASGRGQDATSAQKTAASGLVADLIAVNPTPEPARDPAIAGDWELVYADTHLFRSSPFFWAVGRMMGPENADFFYDAHAHQTGIFGGGVGRVVQSIDPEAGRLVSDCVVRASVGVPLLGFAPIFAGYGSVITAARAVPIDAVRLAVTVEATTVRQDDATVLPQLNFLNGTTVPVEDVMRQIGGGAAPEVYIDTVYLDDELRISKLEDGSVLVYQRA